MLNKSIKSSPRRRVRLPHDEIEFLENFVKSESAPFATIKKNTGIRRPTIIETIKRGWIELEPAIRLRDFIKTIQAETV